MFENKIIIKTICSWMILVLDSSWLGTKMFVEILLMFREKSVLVIPLHNVDFFFTLVDDKQAVVYIAHPLYVTRTDVAFRSYVHGNLTFNLWAGW
jgi:hypothetical protein